MQTGKAENYTPINDAESQKYRTKFLKEAFQVSLQSTGNKKFWQTSFKFKDFPKY